MQLVSAKKHPLMMLIVNLAALMLLSGNVSAQQSVAENITPVGEVCLQGQSCVGTTAGGSQTAAAVTAAPAAVVVETVAQPVAAAAAAAPEVAAFDVAATYQMSCFACHASGAAGAPIVGEADAWSDRMSKGMEAVMANVVNGLNAMPPKGMCMTCSDNDLQALVDYMVAQ